MKLLITGATGYIGKHVVRRALGEGHQVRASLRSRAREAELRAAVGDGDLEIVELDLTKDDGWADAMSGIEGLLHTASPVPVGSDASADAIIGAAVNGTRRAIENAAREGVRRVVVTSSTAAIFGCNRPDDHIFGPDDWTDPDLEGVGAYAKSKTLAELLAREISAATPGMSLATVNPGFVFGAPLDRHWASSVVLIDRLLKGKDPMLPRLSFPSISVHDVAEAHLRALSARDGARIVASDRTFWLSEIADIVRSAAPSARAAKRTAPNWVVRFLSRFDPTIRFVVNDLGRYRRTDSSSLAELLERPPAPPEDAIAETARALVDQQR